MNVFKASSGFNTMLSPLKSVHTFFSEAPLIGLIFLAAVLFSVGGQVSHRSPWPKRLGLLTFLALCVHGYVTASPQIDDSGFYVSLAVRSTLAFVIVDNGATISFGLLAWIRAHASKLGPRTFGNCTRIGRHVWHIVRPPGVPEPVAVEPPPPPLPRAELLRQAAAQARSDFDVESQIIRSAGLSSEEEEAALDEAKQKLIRRLRETLR